MHYLLYKYLFLIILSVSFVAKASLTESSQVEQSDFNSRYSILLVEEGAHSLGFYDSRDGKEYARVALPSLPHEIAISEDQTKAYIPNFGLRDYDLTIGNAGNSISVINLEKQCEIYRLYTTFNGQNYWAPHGIKIKGDKLYVNVECTSGRLPDTAATLGQQTRILIFDLKHDKSIGLQPSLGPPMVLMDIALPHVVTVDAHEMGGLSIEAKTSYSVLAGTHNFVFSPLENEDDLWYYAGLNGVCRIDKNDGRIKLHYPTNRTDPENPISFNGAVRGISFSEDGKLLVIAAYNQMTVLNTDILEADLKKLNKMLKKYPSNDERIEALTKKIIRIRINNLGVTQLFYPKFIPGTKKVLVPAPLDNQVLVIDTDETHTYLQEQDRVLQRIVTGVDPLQVMISPHNTAFVTNADSPWVSEIDLKTFKVIRDVATHQTVTAQGGPNGMAFSLYVPPSTIDILKLGACLPFTGEYAGEARECRLGLQFWEQMINAAGGAIWQGKRHHIKIIYKDTQSSTDENTLRATVDALSKPDKDGVVAILGTYPPLANKPIANALKGKRIPFITSTGRESDLFEENPGYVFGISPIKHEADLISTLRAIFHSSNLISKPRKALILACDHDDSKFEALELARYAQDNEIQILLPNRNKILLPHENFEDPYIKYNHNKDVINDLISQLSLKAQEKVKYCPDILFVIGHRQESLDIVKACGKYKFTPGVIALNTGIINPAFTTQLGSLADNLLGSVCWWDSCCDFANDRFVSSSDFQRNFYSIYGQNPSELVAGFAASGIVFEEALRRQKQHEELKDTIVRLNFTTFYGPIQFDENGQNKKKEIRTVRFEREGSVIKAISLWPK